MGNTLWLSRHERRLVNVVIESMYTDPDQWDTKDSRSWIWNSNLKIMAYYGGDPYQTEILHKQRNVIEEGIPILSVFQLWRKRLQKAAKNAAEAKNYMSLYNTLIDAVGHDKGPLNHKTAKSLRYHCGEMIVKSMKDSPDDWVYNDDCWLMNGHLEIKVWVWKLEPGYIHIDFCDQQRYIKEVSSKPFSIEKWRFALIQAIKDGKKNKTLKIETSSYQNYADYKRNSGLRRQIKKDQIK